MHYSSRRGRNGPQSDSQVIRATASVSASLSYLLGVLRVGLHRAMGVVLPPHWAWKVGRWAKKDYSWALRSKGICMARFWTSLCPVTPFFLPVFPFCNGNVYPIPVHHCILKAHNLSGFVASQPERIFASRLIIAWVSPISDLDEALDFRVDTGWNELGLWGPLV